MMKRAELLAVFSSSLLLSGRRFFRAGAVGSSFLSSSSLSAGPSNCFFIRLYGRFSSKTYFLRYPRTLALRCRGSWRGHGPACLDRSSCRFFFSLASSWCRRSIRSAPAQWPLLSGLKVWLFYLPMLLLGRAYVRDRATLLRLSRSMIGLIWLPCSIGILQWLRALALGYQRAITMFYGDAARPPRNSSRNSMWD